MNPIRKELLREKINDSDYIDHILDHMADRMATIISSCQWKEQKENNNESGRIKKNWRSMNTARKNKGLGKISLNEYIAKYGRKNMTGTRV